MPVLTPVDNTGCSWINVLCNAQSVKELKQQLSSLKQDLAAEVHDLEELVVCSLPLLLATAGVL